MAKEHYNLETVNGVFNSKSPQVNSWHNKYNLVCSWDVLEHVAAPEEFLTSSYECLKKDGVLAFSTVNIGSLFTKILGSKWPWYMLMHLHYFSKDSLRMLLEKQGFQNIQFRTYRHVISLAYFIEKIASLTNIHLLKKLAIKPFKNIFIPFAFGDIVLVTAEKN
jgi:2-polyprenyl-3-methyl-5-hydroxy-6-metoxy-1,4-benzoquinol methylase